MRTAMLRGGGRGGGVAHARRGGKHAGASGRAARPGPAQRRGADRRCARHRGRGGRGHRRAHQRRRHHSAGEGTGGRDHRGRRSRRTSRHARAHRFARALHRSRQAVQRRSQRPSIKTMDDVLQRVAAFTKDLKPGDWVQGPRLGRGETGGTPLHHGGGPRQGGAEQPGVADADHGALRRGQLARDEDGRGPQGDEGPAGRHDRSRRAGQPDRRDEGSGAGAHHRARAAADARAAEARHRADHRGLQPRGDDGRQGPGHRRAEVGHLPGAAQGGPAERPRLRAVGRPAEGGGHRRR